MSKTDKNKASKRVLSDFPELIMERFPIANGNPIIISLKYMLNNFEFSENESEENVVKAIENYFEVLVSSDILKSWKKEYKNGVSFEIVYSKEFISDIKANNLALRKELDKVVLDSKAILALLTMDEGHEVIAQNLENAFVSSVNIAEVLMILVKKEINHKEAAQLLKDTFPQVEPFNAEQAVIASSFEEPELSFGDRACLALARSKNLRILSPDKDLMMLEIKISEQHIVEKLSAITITTTLDEYNKLVNPE
jgi:PIN domain nuclease of toxin-antitoxin system